MYLSTLAQEKKKRFSFPNLIYSMCVAVTELIVDKKFVTELII